MNLPIIIAIPATILFFAGWILAKIVKDWWAMKNEPPREVNEAERPAIIKPHRRFYKGKGL